MIFVVLNTQVQRRTLYICFRHNVITKMLFSFFMPRDSQVNRITNFLFLNIIKRLYDTLKCISSRRLEFFRLLLITILIKTLNLKKKISSVSNACNFLI